MTKHLLPHYCRKIGLGLFTLAIAGWLLNSAQPDLLNMQPFLLGWIGKIMILTSLLLFVFSREKLETERITQLRISSLFTAVPAGCLLVIFEFFAEVLFEGENAQTNSGYEIMVFVLLMYYISFYIKKNIKTVPAKVNSK